MLVVLLLLGMFSFASCGCFVDVALLLELRFLNLEHLFAPTEHKVDFVLDWVVTAVFFVLFGVLEIGLANFCLQLV